MYRFRNRIGKALKKLLSIVYPKTCAICGRRLYANECRNICGSCLIELPTLTWFKKERTPALYLFLGNIPIVNATSFMKYSKGSISTNIIKNLKYHNRPDAGRELSFLAAKELKETAFFDGIDLIIPVPLSKKRFRKRGYNQSFCIAQGISDATNIPINDEAVIRIIDNVSQTKTTEHTRAENVKGIFYVANPQSLKGKHILLVDDVLTTGATLKELGHAIKQEVNATFSIFTLAASKNISYPPNAERIQ